MRHEQPFSSSDGTTGEDSETRRRFAEQIYKVRELRSHYFPDFLFGEPAWDILLLLYGAERHRERLSTRAVCMSAGVPSSTAHRWMVKLVQAGVLMREECPRDGRYCWIRLSERAVAQLDAYFDEILKVEFKRL